MMSQLSEKADVAFNKMNEIPGVYANSLRKFTSKIQHMAKKDIYRITIDLDAEQLGGGKCVAQVLDTGDKLKLVPVIVFIDPDEASVK